ncbi:MAG: Glu-tRNA(Gln) amidotransferase subunit GatE [Nanoarchaeota archaeon]|nr:Glu-tRNA(Gln) amidotransferase subunit GatE [Nanoarchaeota archaeon]MBU1321183.1 Glu-tRNA(Gln) amidotransferase subunit GatE [Nanoarchaeota archaeon]MBU1598315.1 Glu-tRNA(Gln) amidotransferase subunit GatE [Nanoarchaeota archaeon]MBU2441109.1 Glu-tRNA(Gln) amidotransferase subunit GatE [Nanoarchaeota archaeon]
MNYDELGFKCGIEIHQQLEGHKLFCHCPTEIRKGEPDFEVVRRLRASAGEEGRVDQAALHEQKKQKYFVYQGYNDITCDVELDEEPPHPINKEALAAALQVALMTNCQIVDELQVMRKTVIDGSNTSGFQRTMLIGINGFIEVDGRKISIDGVFLEEEACQIIERTKDYDVYNLSRMGIPLIEIATGPDITTPEEAKEVAAKIGMILRSTGACKRGIGTIRQDVNISIKGLNRVEIKGFQDYKKIPKALDIEIKRHLDIIKKGKKIEKEVRKLEPDFTTSFQRPMPGGHRMYPETDIPPIVPDMKDVKVVKTIEEKVDEIVTDFKLSKDLAVEIVKQDIDFLKIVRDLAKLQPKFIADIIINAPKEIKKRFKKDINVLEHLEVLEKANKNNIPTSAVFEILTEIAQGQKPDFNKYQGMSEAELEQEVIRVIQNNPDAPINALMGMLMAQHRGKIDGKKAMEFLELHKK